MSKFIKVIEQACGEVRLTPTSSIKEILEDGNGSVVFYGDKRFYTKESLEKIEAQLLRDEFAMRALSGFCADKEMTTEGAIRLSYEYADAMLKERLK